MRVYDRGAAVMELCLQPAKPLPEGDVIVLHKHYHACGNALFLSLLTALGPPGKKSWGRHCLPELARSSALSCWRLQPAR